MEFIAKIMADAPTWILAVSGVVTALTVITAMTPTQLDDIWLERIRKGVNLLLRVMNSGAGNVGNNKNKDERK